MARDLLNNTRHWIERAEEARSVAEAMTTAEARRTMLDIAAQYERLAEHARRRAATAHTVVVPETLWKQRG